jgi:hypothetical protein
LEECELCVCLYAFGNDSLAHSIAKAHDRPHYGLFIFVAAEVKASCSQSRRTSRDRLGTFDRLGRRVRPDEEGSGPSHERKHSQAEQEAHVPSPSWRPKCGQDRASGSAGQRAIGGWSPILTIKLALARADLKNMSPK